MGEIDTVFYVEAFGGQYDDKWSVCVGIFSTYDKALAAAKKECRKYYIDESKLPMTFDEYREFNFGYPDIPEEGYDEEDECLVEYYENETDRNGYKAEDFKYMAHLNDLVYEDFTGCRIQPYVLDSERNVNFDEEDDVSMETEFIYYDDDGGIMIN